jgi:integrase
MKARITKRLVDSLKAPGTGRLRCYDDQLPGFGVVVYPSGRKSFVVEYGPASRRRRMTLGRYGPLTVDQARTLAMTRLGEVAHGQDPLSQRQERARVPTVAEWVAEYLEGVRLRKKHPRHDERYLADCKDRWGSRKVSELTRREVELAMRSVGERGHTSANRWLASLRACLNAAVGAGVLQANPAAGIRAFKEAPPRDVTLNDAEYARVVEAIHAETDPHVRGAFLLLLDTGARKSEVLRARWEDIDPDGGLWRIPSPKSGRPQVIPLTPSTLAMLQGIPRVGPWVVPGRDPSKHRADLKSAWARIRDRAGISKVTVHDLRRTFGLHVARRAGLHVASKLLRHSDIRVTERVYAPLGIDGLRDAVQATQDHRGQVIELEKARKAK